MRAYLTHLKKLIFATALVVSRPVLWSVKAIWRLIKMRGFWIALERVILVVAAVAAMFPLYEYWSERGERRYNRLVQAVIAQNGCSEIWSSNLQNILLRWEEEGYHGGGLPNHIDENSPEADRWWENREQEYDDIRRQHKYNPATAACFRLMLESYFNDEIGVITDEDEIAASLGVRPAEWFKPGDLWGDGQETWEREPSKEEKDLGLD